MLEPDAGAGAASGPISPWVKSELNSDWRASSRCKFSGVISHSWGHHTTCTGPLPWTGGTISNPTHPCCLDQQIIFSTNAIVSHAGLPDVIAITRFHNHRLEYLITILGMVPIGQR